MRNFLNFLVITFFVFSIFIGCETKETTKITVLSINNINCLNWEIGTHESDIVQNGWEKTISPNGVTKYDAEYYAEDATLYYHLYFVNKRLGHIHITLLGFTHGNMSIKNMQGWLQVEARDAWGMAKWSEIHAGHIHHQKGSEFGCSLNGDVSEVIVGDKLHCYKVSK